MANDEPTLDEVKAAIDRLRREDRAMLRPWILARYDVRGYESRGYASPASTPESRDRVSD
jgi:hypothetical protein